MSLKLTSITLNTAHLEDMLKFYGILGVDFKESKVDKGSQVCRATIEACEFSLYSSESVEKNKKPTLQITFVVAQIEQKILEVTKVPGVICIMDPTAMPDGKKAIVLDPDGNAVELKEI